MIDGLPRSDHERIRRVVARVRSRILCLSFFCSLASQPLAPPGHGRGRLRRHAGAAAWRYWVPAVLTEREVEKLLKGGTERSSN